VNDTGVQQSGEHLNPGASAIIQDLCRDKGILIAANSGEIAVKWREPGGKEIEKRDQAPALQFPRFYGELVWAINPIPTKAPDQPPFELVLERVDIRTHEIDPAKRSGATFDLDEMSASAKNSKASVVNNGFDDKINVVCVAVYTDGSSTANIIASKVSRGDKAEIELKPGLGVSSFTIYCDYGGHLRQCGEASSDSRQGFRTCNLWWAASGSYESTLAFGS